MQTLIVAVLLFLLGLRLSAFFSGSETGFYRVSFLRISLDARDGDRTAKRILWFLQNPSYFVATTLVGNNVANYLTTFAIGLGSVAWFQSNAEWVEVASALLISPVIFLFGELVPKSVYFRAPLYFLRRDVRWFTLFYRLFLVVSFPLIALTRLIQRFGTVRPQSTELVLGRGRLIQLMRYGQDEGILKPVQGALVHGLMQTSSQPITESLVPLRRVTGVTDQATREEVLQHAHQHGLSAVAVRRPDEPDGWYGYYRVVDLEIVRRPLPSLLRRMPEVRSTASKLDAMMALRAAGAVYCVVRSDAGVVGLASETRLVEDLFRSPQTPVERLETLEG